MGNLRHTLVAWLTCLLYLISPFFIVLLFHQVIRYLFIATYFAGSRSFTPLFLFYKWGIRFDVQVISILAIPAMMLCTGMEMVRKKMPGHKFVFILVLLFQLPGLLLNIFDWIYYRHSLHRSGIEIAELVEPGLRFARGIWRMYHMELLAAFLLLAAVGFTVWLSIKKTNELLRKKNRRLRLAAMGTMLVLLVSATGIFQKRLLIPSSPLMELPSNWLVFGQNSGNNFLYSLQKSQQELKQPAWMNSVDTTLIRIRKQYQQTSSFDSANIVVFVLESMNAAELDSSDPHKAYTPFLDSLRRTSINIRNTIANGFQSYHGMIALFGSIPPFLSSPVYNSMYNSKQFDGIGNVLNEKGYSGFFALGAERDHFGFEKWMRMVGARHFYSKESPGKQGEEDGNWGVFDHVFIPSLVYDLDTIRKPFWGGIFNLSSHPPFSLPSSWHSRSPQKQIPYRASIEYVDYSLRLFFEKARNSDWFRNTYFLFIADHAFAHEEAPAENWVSRTSIPFFIYHPSFKRSMELKVPSQQLDLTPTVLDLLRYDESFISFGESVFRKGNRYGFTQLGDILHVYDGDVRLDLNLVSGNSAALYYYKQDSLLKQNRLMDEPDRARLLREAGKSFYFHYYRYLTGTTP